MKIPGLEQVNTFGKECRLVPCAFCHHNLDVPLEVGPSPREFMMCGCGMILKMEDWKTRIPDISEFPQHRQSPGYAAMIMLSVNRMNAYMDNLLWTAPEFHEFRSGVFEGLNVLARHIRA